MTSATLVAWLTLGDLRIGVVGVFACVAGGIALVAMARAQKRPAEQALELAPVEAVDASDAEVVALA